MDIDDLIAGHFGHELFKLISQLSTQPDYSEFKLAEALGKEVNDVRNMLYKLHSLNLASFTRKKDKKIGWYIYYWTFHSDRALAYLYKEKKARLDSLLAQEGDAKSFYACNNNCVSFDFDQACELSFQCPECGELLNEVQKESFEKEIEETKKEISRLAPSP